MFDKKYILFTLLAIIFVFLIFFLTLFFVSSGVQENSVATNSITFPKQSIQTENFNSDVVSLNSEIDKEARTEEEYNLSDAIKYTKRQEALEKKIKSLTIQTNQNLTIEKTCANPHSQEEINCKKGLFLSCVDSIYFGFEMAEECKQFDTKYYDEFLNIKERVDESIDTGENFDEKDYIVTDFGNISVRENTTSKKEILAEKSINSSEINNDRIVVDLGSLIKERTIIEPEKAASIFQSIYLNTKVKLFYSGWITGWATLFAINGGRDEAGFRMNQYTAFGYNPYSSKTCIVSLPYKTIDKFYGTTLDYCVKTKNTSCIIKTKNKIKNAAIEIVMIKNGKKAILPLGDFGPAEWTGNALDLTNCGKNLLGATGKDIVKFRPLYR